MKILSYIVGGTALILVAIAVFLQFKAKPGKPLAGSPEQMEAARSAKARKAKLAKDKSDTLDAIDQEIPVDENEPDQKIAEKKKE